MDDALQCGVSQRLDHCMDVIIHHNVCVKRVTLTMEECECAGDKRALRIAERGLD